MCYMTYEYGEPCWNDIDGKAEEVGEKPVPGPLCVHHKSHMDLARHEPGLHSDRPATNCLSHGTASTDLAGLWII
jgi:hypothetical protein